MHHSLILKNTSRRSRKRHQAFHSPFKYLNLD